MRTSTIAAKDAGKTGSKKSSKAKRYSKIPSNTSMVKEPDFAAYVAPKHSALHLVPGRLSKKNIPLKNEGMRLVPVSKSTKRNSHSTADERPVHKISFNEKLQVIENGFQKKSLLQLKDKYGITSDALAKILNITNRTIQSKAMTFKFTGNVAEKILGLSEVYSYGMEVFEEEEKFRAWLQVGSPVLGSKRPLDLLCTQLGMQQVLQELARIDYGIY